MIHSKAYNGRRSIYQIFPRLGPKIKLSKENGYLRPPRMFSYLRSVCVRHSTLHSKIFLIRPHLRHKHLILQSYVSIQNHYQRFLFNAHITLIVASSKVVSTSYGITKIERKVSRYQHGVIHRRTALKKLSSCGEINFKCFGDKNFQKTINELSKFSIYT